MNIYEAAKVEWFEKCAEIYLEKIALGTTAAPGGFNDPPYSFLSTYQAV